MSHQTLTTTTHEADSMLEAIGDTATELVGAAAGAVADPRTGLHRLRRRMTNPVTLLIVLVVIAVLGVVKLRGRT